MERVIEVTPSTKFQWVLLAGIGNVIGGGILVFTSMSLRLSHRANYFPQGRELVSYSVYSFLAASIILISLFVWLRERRTPKTQRGVLSMLAPLFLALAAFGFLGGGFLGEQMVTQNLENQKRWDRENCDLIMSKGPMKLKKAQSCKVYSRDCRNEIDCDRLSAEVQEGNMSRWPKTYKQPSNTCSTARLLCIMDKMNGKNTKIAKKKSKDQEVIH